MSEEIKYGQGPGIQSEELVKELLQQAGWGVTETRKAAEEDMAPVVEGGDADGTRLPDFLAQHERFEERYVEVKSKERPIEYGIENELRHGYEKPQHEDYLKYREMSGSPVYIFVHERANGVIKRQRVRNLSGVQTLTDKDKLAKYGTDEPMVFFRRDNFELVVDNISQYLNGFAQGGLFDSDAKIAPFGLTSDTAQIDFGDLADEADHEDSEQTPRRRVAEIVRAHNTITVPELVTELVSKEPMVEREGLEVVKGLAAAGFLYLKPKDAPIEEQRVKMP